jgi:membrane protein YfhO
MAVDSGPKSRLVRDWSVEVAIAFAVPAARLLIERLQGYVHAGADLIADLIPAFAWWWERPRLLGGWNPWIFGGYPAGADPLFGQVHPLGLLYAVAPPLAATEIDAVLTPALAAIGMMLYLRTIGCGRIARVVGGMSFSLGGFMASQATHPPQMRAAMAIPWALAAIEGLEGRRLVAGLAVATGALIASGHPQMISYALGVVVAYAAWLGRPLERGRAVALAGGFALGVGLTAVTWLPAVPHILGSTRNTTVAAGSDFEPLTLHDLPRLVVPFVDGGSTTALFGRSAAPRECTLFDCSGYPGMLALLLLLGCAVPLLHDARGRFWIAFAVAGVFLATGTLGPIPPVAGIRAIARLLVWWNVAVAAAAGLALQSIVERRADAWRRGKFVAFGALACLIAWAAATSPIGARASLASGGALFLTGVAVAEWRGFATSGRAWWMVVVLAIDLLAYASSIPVGLPLSDYHEGKHLVSRLVPDDRADSRSALERRMAFPFFVGADWASIEKIPVLQGYGSLASSRYASLLGQSAGSRDAEVGLIRDDSLASPSSHVLDLLRCRFVVAIGRFATRSPFARRMAMDDPRWRSLGPSQGGGQIYVNQQAFPVAWLVHRVRVVPDEAALHLVRGTSAHDVFDPAHEVLLAEDPSLTGVGAGSTTSDEVVLERYDEDEIQLRVGSAAPGVLVTSELASPGWEATIDGEQREVLTANYAFRAVVVPPGAHEVVLRYRPPAARIGLAISLASLACLPVLARRRTPRVNQGPLERAR